MLQFAELTLASFFLEIAGFGMKEIKVYGRQNFSYVGA